MTTAKTGGGAKRGAKKVENDEPTGRLARWRSHTFGPASELPYRRRTSDWVRLVLAVVILAFAIENEGSPGDFEQNLYALLNGLPGDLRSFFTALYDFAALWALGIIVVAALIARRWRLARDLAIAGGAAWIIGRIVGVIVVDDESLETSLDIVTRLGDASPSFPVVRLAVVVAVVVTAGPYLTRPVRRLGQVLVLALALSAMYLGTGDPNAVLAALGLGWGIGAAVHLVWGSPGGRPTRRQIAAALEELEIPTLDVELAPVQSPSATLMVARDREGPLHVRVLGRDETDAQFWSKAWRWLLYKDSGPELHLTRLSDVEHEAYSLLLAARAGCRVPEVLVAGTAGPGAALLVTRPLEGERLADAGARALTERRLADLWDQLRRLHEAHVGHGALNAHHLIMTSKGIGIDDFSRATGAASDARRGSDIAELLATTAVLVGNDRAVKAAVAGLGREKIASALPFLQTAALSHEMRAHKHHDKKAQADELTQLREAAAKAVRTEAPPLQQLYRVSSTNVLMAVGTLIAVFALLSQVGDPEEFWNTIKNADWAWLVAALGLSFLTNFATAISLSGTVPINLPLLRTAELQLSMSFSNLAVPAIGGMAAQIRFLQKQGVDLASAVASGGLLANVGNIVACTLLFFVALFLSPTSIKTGEIPVDQVIQVVILIAVLIAIALVLIFKIQRLRKLVLPPVTSGAKTIWAAIRSPRRLFQLFGGNILNALMYAAVMMFCLYAFGGEMNYWTLLAINIFVGTIASLVPIPGGGTAVASVGMSGALTAAGISTEVAVAAVLANQLVANFIPAVPGWFATNNLLKDDYL